MLKIEESCKTCVCCATVHQHPGNSSIPFKGSIMGYFGYACLLPFYMGKNWSDTEDCTMHEVIFMENIDGKCECYQKRQLTLKEVAKFVSEKIEQSNLNKHIEHF